nr:MAG TPA: hypothetical protein [Caudoviricetes sp.]
MKCYRTTGNEPGTLFRRVTFSQKKSFLAWLICSSIVEVVLKFIKILSS